MAGVSLDPRRFLGRGVLRATTHVGRLSFFVFELGRGLGEWREWFRPSMRQAQDIGYRSLFIVFITASFAGAVTVLQAGYQLTAGVPIYFAAGIVVSTIILELGPVLTGLILAGRIGARFAAELGTMRVTEQVDALETLAYDPNSYLVVPRVVAATLMFPVVVAIAVAVGVVSGWVTAVNLLDLSTTEFVKGLRLFYQFKDIWFGLVKAMSFGLAIALIGCYHGLTTRGGAEGVGRETTTAVVRGAEAILVLDAFWAVVLL